MPYKSYEWIIRPDHQDEPYIYANYAISALNKTELCTVKPAIACMVNSLIEKLNKEPHCRNTSW